MEAITNIIRHSKADKFKVQLRNSKLNFIMTISDNGVGFGDAINSNTNSLGLLGMNERAFQHGGIVVADNQSSSGGAQITVRIPKHQHDPELQQT